MRKTFGGYKHLYFNFFIYIFVIVKKLKSMDKDKTLVIVDVQRDFYHPNGSLYVKGGETIIPVIKKIVPHFKHIIFTLDWHPINHISFKERGGLWPIHCVKYTEGVSIPLELVDYCSTMVGECNVMYYLKGFDSNIEEYGAFREENISKCFIDESVLGDVVVCGIAGDYCVLETTKNLINLIGKDRVSLYLDGIVSIDGGDKLKEYIKENDIKTY